MAERDMYAIATEYATLLGCGSPHGSHRVVLPATWYEDVLTISRGLRNARDDLSFLRGLRDDALATRGEIEALDEQHRAALAQIERWRPVVEAAETQATVHTAVRRRADNQSLNDYGAAIDATNQAVRAMRAQAKESQA